MGCNQRPVSDNTLRGVALEVVSDEKRCGIPHREGTVDSPWRDIDIWVPTRRGERSMMNGVIEARSFCK